MTVTELKLGLNLPVSISVDDLTLEAFHKMAQSEKTGCAVTIDCSGRKRLVGNISASDLRVFGEDGQFVERVFLPASDFLALKSAGLVNVNPTSTLESVLYLFWTHRTPRVYVVDEDTQYLIGVITPFDIFALF